MSLSLRSINLPHVHPAPMSTATQVHLEESESKPAPTPQQDRVSISLCDEMSSTKCYHPVEGRLCCIELTTFRIEKTNLEDEKRYTICELRRVRRHLPTSMEQVAKKNKFVELLKC
ncbi:hypothetical protein CFOL_v3_06638 [Cephalotus follicularis]|uniref:Uncharacterized protein n=1 Tax=Cephalotus follicularis TaxID=3775 RepID=A0A1Q3B531_CEPFO|nr:hypothetical protein CFOL_v3_06638 [Cephalotus follicularis]